jgi:hypothetical protein
MTTTAATFNSRNWAPQVSGRKMIGRHLRNRSITFVEDSIGGRDSDEVDQISSLDNTALNQEAESKGIVMSECVDNNSGSIITTEISVSMSARQLQDLVTKAFSTLRTDIVAIIKTDNLNLDSKLQVATENIAAKIQQENEKLSEKLIQKLQDEVKKLSNDICTLRSDTEHKFQEVTKTIGGISVATNEKIGVHVIATRKLTDRISQEMNARSGHLFDDMKEYRTQTENSLKEFRQDYSLLRGQMNLEQAAWQNKAGGERDEMNDNVRLVEERVARLVEDRVTEIQAAVQSNIQKVIQKLQIYENS